MQHTGNGPAESLGEEITTGNALLQLLKQEQAHLIAANIDAMGTITEEKAKLVARMTELAQRRHRALLTAGFDASESGMQAWLNKGNATTGKSWGELISIAQQAKELNRVNGLLIGQHMGRNQAALNALQSGAQQGAALYGPNGQSTTPLSTRRIVIG